jgi:sterol carrier protein 2
MSQKVFVTGVGMIPFAKPGASAPYHEMGAHWPPAPRWMMPASPTTSVEQAYVGYVYGDSTCGQKALYGVGMTGIPIVNVNNNCSTGSTALYLARQAVQSGAPTACWCWASSR